MEHNTIYNTARELAEKVKRERPCYSGLEASVIISDKGTFLGVTGVNAAGGQIVDVPADVTAFLNMRNSGGRIALGLAVVKLEDMSFTPPSAEALELMFRANTVNDGCLVCLGADEDRLLSALRLGTNSDSMMDGFDGFDADDASVNTTANVISGVAVDESNPFFERSETVAPPEDTLSDETKEADTDPAGNKLSEPELTAEDLLKQAKKRKSVAKSNFLFRKKHK